MKTEVIEVSFKLDKEPKKGDIVLYKESRTSVYEVEEIRDFSQVRIRSLRFGTKMNTQIDRIKVLEKGSTVTITFTQER